jgi:hypothetical protein
VLNPRYSRRVLAQRLGRYTAPEEQPPPFIGFS